ncbi:MAG: GntR family transcriptional regulator [Paracoccaceae bacterium]
MADVIGPGGAAEGVADGTASEAKLTDQAHQALLAQLRDGRLPSGMFLSMPMLVERLGFPMAAVREAVKRAEGPGLVTVLPKRGLMVMQASPGMTRECLELRALLDAEGARRLIARGAEMPLADLRAAHLRLRDAAETAVTPEMQRRAILTDLSLHDLMARGLGPGVMGRIYDENRDRIAVIQTQRPFLPDRIVSAMTEHLEIIAALEARDAEQAAEAIAQHLRHTKRWWGVEQAGPEQG